MKQIWTRLTSPGMLLFFIMATITAGYAIVGDLNTWVGHIAYAVITPVLSACFLVADKKWFIQFIGLIRRDLLPVEIVDKDGKNYTLARRNKNGELTANQYYMMSVSPHVLNDDGTAVRSYTISTITRWWLPISKDKRVEHLLRYNIPEFEEDSDEQ